MVFMCCAKIIPLIDRGFGLWGGQSCCYNALHSGRAVASGFIPKVLKN